MRFSQEFVQSVKNDYQNGLIGKVDDYIVAKGISKSTFYKWVKNNENDASKISFIDITPSITNCSSDLTININDINIKLDNNYDKNLFLKVIKSIKKL